MLTTSGLAAIVVQVAVGIAFATFGYPLGALTWPAVRRWGRRADGRLRSRPGRPPGRGP
ncbi:hypothetical protein BTM25_11580 [Actinomadura rubteroloni]|uniref:Uncharacterized protein n=1 Tax=Actinomadura rubteroloni TaxID=1926885 RepID=A0A2P4UNZ3_9ACTN|nr:hypothetical protein [Actinomadura rubteroloni]POM26752.1 hypothetical protein BTM25_11580 [Actinomadura rubteroloni]